MSEHALVFDDVSLRYPGAERDALVHVSFALEPGEFCVVAGASGSGKSSVLRAACGLAPHATGGELGGTVLVAGLDTREHGPGELAAVAGTLTQDPETQVVLGTVRNELAFPLENRGLPGTAVARGVEEAALALGLDGLLDRSTRELSGGELQRVALAATLAGRPELVLLDEPTSQLDPVAGDELIWFLRRLNEEWGTTVVLIEHRLERCLAAADRVLALDGGRVVCDSLPGEFLSWAVDHAPALPTPAARLVRAAGLAAHGTLPTGVKDARAVLRERSVSPDAGGPPSWPRWIASGRPGDSNCYPPAEEHRRAASAAGRRWRFRRFGQPAIRGPGRALEANGLWHELAGGRAVLRGVDLALAPGERVALMGRNGAGKSTLLRHAAGLLEPKRGSVSASGRVALLLQHPGDHLLHERVGDEAPPAARAAAGVGHLPDGRHPRDLSGGERQRLALAAVLGDAAEPPAAVLLDEPTRGLDRAAKGDLADRLHALAARGTALLVATHDPEFAATVADRVVLLADGRPIADASAREVLTGGWWFATETARVLGGAGGALLPDEGAALLRAAAASRSSRRSEVLA